MEKNTLSSIQVIPGMVLAIGNIDYRILHIQMAVAVLCQMHTGCLNLRCFPLDKIVLSITNKSAHIVETYKQTVFDIERFSPNMRKAFEDKLQIINAVENIYGPSYLGLMGKGKKEPLNKIIMDSKQSRPTVLKIIRRFLQSGEDISCLVHGRAAKLPSDPSHKCGKRAGRPPIIGIPVDATVITQFELALENYKSNRATTMMDAYVKLLYQHYAYWEDIDGGGKKRTLLPLSQIPSRRQFLYYVGKRLSKEDKDILKTSKQEQRNNKRLLLSDNLNGVHGPGDLFKIDEVEVDISLVSRIDPNQVVGRPIVYIMIDVYSRLIIGYSISFDNNSVQGAELPFKPIG